MNIDNINLGYFKDDHSSSCSYCEKSQSASLGFNTALLLPSTYEQLMNRGWRRCGTYYYKYNFKMSCCLAYTIRANTLINQQKKGQRKIAKNFLKVLNSDLLQNKITDFPKFMKESKETLEKSKQNKQDIKQKAQQQQQPVQQQQQKQPNKQQEAIPQETIDQFKMIFTEFLTLMKSKSIELINSFKEYFDKKGFKIEEVYQIFQFDVNINNVKIFKSQVQNKGDFYTNFIMLLYGLNKKLLFQDFSVEQFAKCLIPFILQYLKHEEFTFVLELTGFLSIFNNENQERLLKHVQVIEKKVQEMPQKIQQEPILHKAKNIQLIDQKTFKTNSFFIGQMKVILKPAQCTDENFDLYRRYCKEIHGKSKESKSGYEGFLCEQGLKKDLIKSQIDNGVLLFIGCYHMCYYLQDKLVAIGVVDITENVLSSVYFFYDPLFEWLNFGTFGALVEIEYIQILNQYFPNFKYYYLGFYLQTTNKMLYKGDFEPCELLCPETYNWTPLTKELRGEIDKRQAQPPKQRQLKISNQQVIEDMQGIQTYETVKISFQGKVYNLNELNFDQKRLKPYLDGASSRMGKKLMQTIVFSL